MATTDIGICSAALLKLGEDPISSFNDGTDPSDTCKVLYPSFAKHCLSMHAWNFARKKVQLARLVETPVNQWAYAYQMPSDSLRVLGVFTSDNVRATPTPDYDIFYNQVYSNDTTLYLDYIAEVPEADWPAYFEEFVKTAFAAELALPITNQQDLKQDMWQKAYGTINDNMKGGLLGMAMSIDAKQIPPRVIRYNSIIDARFGSFR